MISGLRGLRSGLRQSSLETALFSLDFSFSREFRNINIDTVFARITAVRDYFFFRIQTARLFEGGDYVKCCSLEVVP